MAAATTRGLRCPRCGKKVGDYLDGVYGTTCPRCNAKVHIEKKDLTAAKKGSTV